jgi:hypothetical protein
MQVKARAQQTVRAARFVVTASKNVRPPIVSCGDIFRADPFGGRPARLGVQPDEHRLRSQTQGGPADGQHWTGGQLKHSHAKAGSSEAEELAFWNFLL